MKRSLLLITAILALCAGGIYALNLGETSHTPAAVEYPLPENVNDPVLILSGNLHQQNAGSPDAAEIAFDITYLEHTLPQHSITTSTRWSDGSQTFSGPRLVDVLSLVGVLPEQELHLIATDHYNFETTAGELIKYEALIATKQNGKRLDVCDKGPLWLVFPRDKYHKVLIEEFYDSYWIWNLYKIEAR